MFGQDRGFLVSFTGQQARFTRRDARPNELTSTRQLYWPYPEKVEVASDYLIAQAQERRESYFSVHLFREAGNRLSANTVPTVRCLWLDEDDGHFPEDGPQPTAIVRSSAERRHVYWQLAYPVAVEWAVAMNRRLASWAGGDTGKAGLSSILRAPGTANYKREPQVDLVVGELTGALPWEPKVMDQAVPEPPTSAAAAREPYDGPELDLAPYLENVEVVSEIPDSLGTKYAIVCPWVQKHSGGDRTGTRIGQRENGALWFHCDHAHCQGRTWREFKRAVFWNRRFTVGDDRPDYNGPTIKTWRFTMSNGAPPPDIDVTVRDDGSALFRLRDNVRLLARWVSAKQFGSRSGTRRCQCRLPHPRRATSTQARFARSWCRRQESASARTTRRTWPKISAMSPQPSVRHTRTARRYTRNSKSWRGRT
jgi:hypothetical protein